MATDPKGAPTTAERLGIRDANTSGQGFHPDAATFPLAATILAEGWTYSHSVGVYLHGTTCEATLHHCWHRADHNVAAWRDDNGMARWYGTHGGSGVKRYGTGSDADLRRYLRGVARRMRAKQQQEAARLRGTWSALARFRRALSAGTCGTPGCTAPAVLIDGEGAACAECVHGIPQGPSETARWIVPGAEDRFWRECRGER